MFRIFIGYQWACFTLMYLASALIPDKSTEVMIQEDRSAFIISKIIDRVPDEADEEMQAILEAQEGATNVLDDDGDGEGTHNTPTTVIDVQNYPFKEKEASTADHEDVQLTSTYPEAD